MSLSILNFLDAVSKKHSLPLSSRGLRHNALDLGVGHVDKYRRREDVVKTTNDVTLNNLGCDVGCLCDY